MECLSVNLYCLPSLAFIGVSYSCITKSILGYVIDFLSSVVIWFHFLSYLWMTAGSVAVVVFKNLFCIIMLVVILSSTLIMKSDVKSYGMEKIFTCWKILEPNHF
jgi:heme/copper-type cytochrome/quinol oxidase subunit 4